VTKVWQEGKREPGLPPEPPAPPPPPSPERVYSAFHAARLVGDLDDAGFHALCVRARDEIPEITDHWEHAAQALRLVHGDKGPTKESMQSDLFILPTWTVIDSKLKEKVASALQQWMGQPFPEKNHKNPEQQEDQKDQEMSLDAMLAYAGDAIYLRYAHNYLRYGNDVTHATRYLFSRTLRGAVVYLLRAGPVSCLGEYVQRYLSDSLEDLLDGKFPDDGNVPLAFRQHAEKCAECQDVLSENYEDDDFDDEDDDS
jgi:hypothetical protein